MTLRFLGNVPAPRSRRSPSVHGRARRLRPVRARLRFAARVPDAAPPARDRARCAARRSARGARRAAREGRRREWASARSEGVPGAPHARPRARAPLSAQPLAPAPAGTQPVREVVLFRSDLGKAGARYTPLATLTLGASTREIDSPHQQPAERKREQLMAKAEGRTKAAAKRSARRSSSAVSTIEKQFGKGAILTMGGRAIDQEIRASRRAR